MNQDTIMRISEYENQMELRYRKDVPMLVFPSWEKLTFLIHGMSVREGGVSTGIYASMNFKEDGEDTQENVRENYRRIAAHLGCDVNHIVRPSLVHGKHVHLVQKEDYGNGTVRPSTMYDTDALITDRPGVTLCATFADCVPLFFADEKHHAVGLAHSGWRGTVKKIGQETIKEMGRAFGSKPEDIQAAIGPCICRGCYEIGEETAEKFRKAMPEAERILEKKQDGHWMLDLRRANEHLFLQAGILPEHITISDICTCCNPGLLFSHRATRGQRGALGAFLGLKE